METDLEFEKLKEKYKDTKDIDIRQAIDEEDFDNLFEINYNYGYDSNRGKYDIFLKENEELIFTKQPCLLFEYYMDYHTRGNSKDITQLYLENNQDKPEFQKQMKTWFVNNPEYLLGSSDHIPFIQDAIKDYLTYKNDPNHIPDKEYDKMTESIKTYLEEKPRTFLQNGDNLIIKNCAEDYVNNINAPENQRLTRIINNMFTNCYDLLITDRFKDSIIMKEFLETPEATNIILNNFDKKSVRDYCYQDNDMIRRINQYNEENRGFNPSNIKYFLEFIELTNTMEQTREAMMPSKVGATKLNETERTLGQQKGLSNENK